MAKYMFSVPTLPKPIWEDLLSIRSSIDVSSQQMVILGVMALKHVAKNDRPVFDQMVQVVRGMYAQDFKPSGSP